MADQFGQVCACCRPGELSLRLAAQADGVLLAPGESFDSEWGYLQVVPLPDPDPARRIRLCSGPADGGAHAAYSRSCSGRTGTTSSRRSAPRSSVPTCRRSTACQAQVPFKVVQLDDGYQSAWGDWTTTNDKFPDGLADAGGGGQASWLHPRAVAGAVRRPARLSHRPRSPGLAAAGSAWPIRSMLAFSTSSSGGRWTPPTRRCRSTCRTLAETLTHRWGFGLLKLDFCYAGALPGRRYDPHATRAQALRRGLEVFRQAAGDETFLLGCGCPFGPAIGVVDAMRIGPDTAPAWEPWFNWAPWATRLLQKRALAARAAQQPAPWAQPEQPAPPLVVERPRLPAAARRRTLA